MWVKGIVVVLLILVIYNLFSSLYYLLGSVRSNDLKIVKHLTYRIAFSLLAFVIILTTYSVGLIQPNLVRF